MSQKMVTNLENYADSRQLELYKKFPTTHYLSNKRNVMNVLAWTSFWRRNLHRCCEDYLQIKLYPYQQITLYEMGIKNMSVIVASRNNAKSFIIAIYACLRCILYPGTIFVIGSATKGQAKLIVSEKIQNELMRWSAPLCREIESVSTSVNDTSVLFRNGSKVIVYTANDNARGNRSHCSCREEFRMINKRIEDNVISPFQTPRRPPYLLDPYYSDMEILYETPVDIYISSSYIDNGDVWMWDLVDQAYEDMMNGKDTVLLAFDESITLKHKLKLPNQLIKERNKQDTISWKTEYLNLRVKDSLSSYFSYTMLTKRQVMKQVFYPIKSYNKHNKKNKFAIPKQDGEVRVISNDIAFVAGSKNDNSVYTCIRGIPESLVYDRSDGAVEVQKGYRRVYSYMESNQIGDTTQQAIRIRQLYEDFDADYIVLDSRSGGVNIVYALQKVLYDEERGVEYAPLRCMNNEEYAKVCQDPDAKPCIYAINASQAINSDIAIAFRKNIIEGRIDFLVNFNTAKEEVLAKIPEYVECTNLEDQVDFFERPFLETQAMISECAELQYEKTQNTNAIKIHEKGANRKDRYTSVSYGSYFIDLLELENMSGQSDYDYVPLVD